MIDLSSFASREALIEHFKPSGYGIEIGVYKGYFANHILNNSNNLELYLLDCWQEQDKSLYQDILNTNTKEMALCLTETINNNINHFNRIKIIKDFSDNAINFFEDNFFDFIYIDANHSYEAAKNDINKWFKKVKKGGLFAGHDYLDGINGNGVFGVKSAVDEFAKEYNIKIYSTNEPHPHRTWFSIK